MLERRAGEIRRRRRRRASDGSRGIPVFVSPIGLADAYQILTPKARKHDIRGLRGRISGTQKLPYNRAGNPGRRRPSSVKKSINKLEPLVDDEHESPKANSSKSLAELRKRVCGTNIARIVNQPKQESKFGGVALLARQQFLLAAHQTATFDLASLKTAMMKSTDHRFDFRGCLEPNGGLNGKFRGAKKVKSA